jgi:hypothetical protein
MDEFYLNCPTELSAEMLKYFQHFGGEVAWIPVDPLLGFNSFKDMTKKVIKFKNPNDRDLFSLMFLTPNEPILFKGYVQFDFSTKEEVFLDTASWEPEER